MFAKQILKTKYDEDKNFRREKEADLPEMALKNVEALADNEIGNGRWIVTVYSPSHWRCDPDGGASCPGTPW